MPDNKDKDAEMMAEVSGVLDFLSRKLNYLAPTSDRISDFLLDLEKSLWDIAKAQKRLDFSIESRRETWRRYKLEQRAKAKKQ